MTNKLTEQEFDKIIGKFCKDLKSVLFNALESSSIDEKNKGFLTWEEVKDQAEAYLKYQEGVYKYEIEGKGCEVLIEGADGVYWFEKGVYWYRMEGEDLVKINNNK